MNGNACKPKDAFWGRIFDKLIIFGPFCGLPANTQLTNSHWYVLIFIALCFLPFNEM
jgi:hypothetical protein